MVPVAQHDGANVNVVKLSSRTIKDHWPNHTARVLCRIVRVIPRASELIGQERVCVRLSRSNGTLRHTRNTILVRSAPLQKSVPVHSSTLFRSSDVVVDRDLNGVSPVGLDGRTRVLTVDEKCRDLISIRSYNSSADGPVVASYRTGRRSLAVRVGRLHSPVTPWLAVLHGSIVGQEERKHRSHEGS